MKFINTGVGGLARVLLCVVLSASAQICLKTGMISLHGVDWSQGVTDGLLGSASVYPAVSWVLAGLSLYVVSLFVWIRSLAHIELSVAYSLLSLNYVLVYLIATQWARIGETASLTRTIGIAIILLGVLIVMSTTGAHTRQSQNPTSK